MIRLRAPKNVASLSVDGSQYNVRDGVIELPPAALRHAIRQGFELLDGQGITEDNIDAAIAKSQQSYVVRLKLEAPEGVASAVVDGEQYEVVDGLVDVPASAVSHLARLGFRLHVEHEDAPLPVLNAKFAPPVVDGEFNVDAASDDDLKKWLKDHDISVIGPSRERMIAAIKKQLETPKE